MKVDILFYGSAVLSVLSFLLFAYQVWIYIQRTAPQAAPPPPAHPAGGLGAAEQQAFNVQQAIQGVQQTVQQLSRLAEAFSKAGPMATSAVLLHLVCPY